MKKKQHILRIVVIVLFFIGIVSAVTIHSYRTRVYATCIFEAGAEIEAKDFLKDTSEEIAFVSDISGVNNKIPGEYTIKLKSGIFTYKCTAIIQDTIAPKAEAVDVFFEEGQEVTPEQFVTNIEDITEVKATYVKEPDYSIFGKQSVEIMLTDAGNNEVVIKSNLITRATVEELEVEVGSAFPEISQFLLLQKGEATFVTSPETIDMNKVGDCNVDISVNGAVYTTVLHLKDTTAPAVKGKSHTAYIGDTVTCEDFIASATDVTNLTYAFVIEPDLKKVGDQTVSIVVTDEGGNSVQKDMKLTVLEDTEPPVITGAKDFTIYLGSGISYKSGVKVTDNHDKNISLKVDNSQVNTKAVGTYPVTYSATDASGNTATKVITVTVLEKPALTEEYVRPMVEQIVNKVVTANMSNWDKAYALYNWCKNNIRYSGQGKDGTIWEAAYQAIEYKTGDCYVYSGTYAALLTVAGIDNVMVYRVGGTTNHRWNLVNTGGGWYHCDSSPRRNGDNYNCFMQTDAQVAAYTESYPEKPNYYVFDTTRYPKRGTKIVFGK